MTNNHNCKRKKAHILGAGPIGLICGWRLSENGYDVYIYEKSNRVGGMCSSWKWNGFILDIGPHIFHTPDESLSKLWKDEFGHLMKSGNFYCQNVKGSNFDKYYNYPLSWEEISNFSKDIQKKIFDVFITRDNLS